MFLNHLKNFFTKNIVKKTISNVENKNLNGVIKSVGILFDESYFNDREELVQEFVKNGISKEDIRILVFKNVIKKKEHFDYPTFSNKDLSWTATFEKSEVKDFMSKKFDLLINYYDIEKSALLIVSNGSKAHFKVGFSSINKKLNHLMINTHAENYKVFVEELFKYLKILNKI